MASSLRVTYAATDTAVPAGFGAFASLRIDVTDSAGVLQTFSLTDRTVLSQIVDNVADGVGNAVATALDVNGATLGSPVTTSFTAPIVVTSLTFPQVTALTVSAV